MASNHSALMDKVYRRQRYIYDLTRKFYLVGRDDLIRNLDVSAGDSVIEVGCGTGRNLVKMARRYPEARLFGLDASQEMLKSAKQAVERAGLTDRIQLAHGLAENLTPSMFANCAQFDHIVFSYSLSMIPDWKQALRVASQASESGKIHIADFGGLNGAWPPAAWLMRLWLSLFHVTPREEILQNLDICSQAMEPCAVPRISPAHYAFIWQGPSKTVRSLAL
jgi:S-adenosylmethionine-diacylgycerolhomoserine-N-methlytransferase